MNTNILKRLSLSAALATAMWAQIPAPGSVGYQDYPYQIAYAAALNVGDAVINITNTGAYAAGLPSGTQIGTTGTICVNAYAFSPDEQMISCCACPVTPNGLRSLSVRRDLTNNTLTPAVPTSIIVKLLASFPTTGTGASCNAAAPVGGGPVAFDSPGLATAVATSVTQLPTGMRAWMATTHNNTLSGTATITEFPFVPATLSADISAGAPLANTGELGRLKQLCGFIQANGSGFGVCTSCALGGLGAGRR